MAQIAIAVPSVAVNNQTIAIVPNSLSYQDGRGEQTVMTQSGGGGSIETVYYDNAESKLSNVKFEMRPTSENISLIEGWKSNLNNNTITLSDQNSNFQHTFRNMALINHYEPNLSSDGVIGLEFAGDPAI